MNLWKDILDSKSETQTRDDMERDAMYLGYRFFSHRGAIYEIIPSVGGGPTVQPLDRSVEECLSPEVWAVVGPDGRKCACIPNTTEPMLFASLPFAVAFANAHAGQVRPWYVVYHDLRRAQGGEQASRIIVP